MHLLGSIFGTILIACWCSADAEYLMCYGGTRAAYVAPMHSPGQRHIRIGRDMQVVTSPPPKPIIFLQPYLFMPIQKFVKPHHGAFMVKTPEWWDDGCRIQCQMYNCFAFKFDAPTQGKPGNCLMYKEPSLDEWKATVFHRIVSCLERFCENYSMREPGYWIQYLVEYRGKGLVLKKKTGVPTIQNAISVCLEHPLCNLFTATTDFTNRTFTIQLFNVALILAQDDIDRALLVSTALNATVRTVIFHECQPPRPLIVNKLSQRPPQVNNSCLGRFVYNGTAPGHVHVTSIRATFYQSQSLCLKACFVTPGCTSVIYELVPVYLKELGYSGPLKCVVMIDDPSVPDSIGVIHGFLWKWQCNSTQVPNQSQLQCKCTNRNRVIMYSSKCSRIVRSVNVTLPYFTGVICTGCTKMANGQQWTEIENPFFPAMKNMLGWVLSQEISLCNFDNCRYYAETKKNKVEKFSLVDWYPLAPLMECLHKKYPLNTRPTLVVIEEVSHICYSDVCAAALRDMQLHHYSSKRWCGSPWNYLISNDGNIFEGRGSSFQPQSLNAAKPRHMLLVAFLGNFTRNMPMPSALQALHVLVNHLKKTKKLDMAAEITTRGGIPVGRRPGVFMEQLIERASFNNPSSDDSSNECPSPLPYTRIICFYITCCFALMTLAMATLLLIWKDNIQCGLMVCKFYCTEATARCNNKNNCQMCSETIFQSTMKLLTQHVNQINAVTLVAEDMELVDAVRHKFIRAAYRDTMVHTFLVQVADVLLSEVSAYFYAVLLENAGGTELRLVTACGVTETANVIVSAVSQTEGWSQSADSSRWKRYFIKSTTKMTVPRGKFCTNQGFWQFVRCIPYADMLNGSAGGLQHLQMDRIDNMSRLIRPCDTLYTSSWDSCPLQNLEPYDEQNVEPDDVQYQEPDDEHSMLIGNMM